MIVRQEDHTPPLLQSSVTNIYAEETFLRGQYILLLYPLPYTQTRTIALPILKRKQTIFKSKINLNVVVEGAVLISVLGQEPEHPTFNTSLFYCGKYPIDCCKTRKMIRLGRTE